MKSAIASLLAAASVAGFAGCDSNAEPNPAGMLRYQLDTPRSRSVALTADGVVIRNARKKVTVPLPGWTWVAEPQCPPEFAVGPNGEIVVTSNVVPTLWKVDPATLQVSTHALTLNADTDKDVGFAAIVYSAGHYVAYSGTQRSVWKIDGQLQSAEKIGVANLERLPCAELVGRLGRLAAISG